MNDKNYNTRFNPQIENIEREMIEKVFKSPLFSFRSPYINIIIAYFASRRFLTQKQIKELTRFSAGEISKDLNELVEQGLIKIIDKNKKGEIIYEMESLKSVMLKRVANLFTTIMSYEDKFNSIKSEMKLNTSMKKLNGYNDIKEVIDYYLGIIPKYKIILSKFKSSIDM